MKIASAESKKILRDDPFKIPNKFFRKNLQFLTKISCLPYLFVKMPLKRFKFNPSKRLSHQVTNEFLIFTCRTVVRRPEILRWNHIIHTWIHLELTKSRLDLMKRVLSLFLSSFDEHLIVRCSRTVLKVWHTSSPDWILFLDWVMISLTRFQTQQRSLIHVYDRESISCYRTSYVLKIYKPI